MEAVPPETRIAGNIASNYYIPIFTGEIVLYDTKMILESLKDYSNPACKLQRLVRDGKYTKVVRGLYESDPSTPGHLLAQAIRSPSYLSFDYALAYHSMIPETVFAFTCATYATGKKKVYRNAFGTYAYRDTSPHAFHLGVEEVRYKTYTYRIATREKALCDRLYTKPPVSSVKEMEAMLFEDMRLEQDDVLGLDRAMIDRLAGCFRSTNVSLLKRYLDLEGDICG